MSSTRSRRGTRALKRTLGALAGWTLTAATLPFTGFAQTVQLDNDKIFGLARFEVLELAPGPDQRPLQWDFSAWVGKSYTRIWFKSDGNVASNQRVGEIELQALYSRLVSPFWELQAGVRTDVAYSPDDTRTRALLVLGLQGMAPYRFELEPALFVSTDGDVSASLVAAYDVFLTQRLLLQPRLETTAAIQESADWSVGSGLNSVVLGARLRYEIRREFAPYVGLNWTRLAGGTADFARMDGEDPSTLSFVVGVRVWR